MEKMMNIIADTNVDFNDTTYSVEKRRESLKEFIKNKLPNNEDVASFVNTLPDSYLEDGVKVYFGPISREDVIYSYNNNLLLVKKDMIVTLVPADENGISKKKWCLKVRILDKSKFVLRFKSFAKKVLMIEEEIDDKDIDILWEELSDHQKLIIIPIIFRKFYARAKKSKANGFEIASGKYFVMIDEGRIWISSKEWLYDIPVKAGTKYTEGECTVRASIWFKAFQETSFFDYLNI